MDETEGNQVAVSGGKKEPILTESKVSLSSLQVGRQSGPDLVNIL